MKPLGGAVVVVRERATARVCGMQHHPEASCSSILATSPFPPRQLHSHTSSSPCAFPPACAPLRAACLVRRSRITAVAASSRANNNKAGARTAAPQAARDQAKTCAEERTKGASTHRTGTGAVLEAHVVTTSSACDAMKADREAASSASTAVAAHNGAAALRVAAEARTARAHWATAKASSTVTNNRSKGRV